MQRQSFDKLFLLTESRVMINFGLIKLFGTVVLLFDFTTLTQINVEIVAPGMIGSSVLPIHSITEPAYDLAIENLNRNYPGMFFTLTYLYDKTVVDCENLRYNVVDMMAKWYYEKRDPRRATFIVTQGMVFL
jgi:hypothetical protein